jgi:hypothetical protein
LEGTLGLHLMEEQAIYASEVSQATNAAKWAHLVMRKLWKISWALWENRNEEEHKSDQDNHLKQLLRQVDKEIDMGTQGHQQLKKWFSRNMIEKVRKGTAGYISCWLRSLSMIRTRLAWIADLSDGYNQMRKVMRQFLTQTTK